LKKMAKLFLGLATLVKPVNYGMIGL